MGQFKPNQQVRVNAGEYQYVGEAMSFQTPTGTVMVRRVINYPGTLEEMPVDKLTPSDVKCRYVHYAIVGGSGSFPVDMLRYDQAAPVNFSISREDQPMIKIDPSFHLEGLWIAHASPWAKPNWTLGRWRSFLWGCKHMKTEKLNGR